GPPKVYVYAVVCFPDSGQAVPHGATCLARCEPGYEPSTNLTCKDGQLEPLTLFECASGGAAPAAPASGAWGVGLDPGLTGPPARERAARRGHMGPRAAAVGGGGRRAGRGADLRRGAPADSAMLLPAGGAQESRTALVRAGGPEDSEGEGDTSEDGEEAATHALLQPRAETPRPGPPSPVRRRRPPRRPRRRPASCSRPGGLCRWPPRRAPPRCSRAAGRSGRCTEPLARAARARIRPAGAPNHHG
ncbi:unnamed protein product, partial [Prorocentrum cordatum]